MLNREDDATVSTTISPSAGPTLRPTFDVEKLARDSGFRGMSSLLSDAVLEVVSDLSWRDAQLDLVETALLAQIDGVSPVVLLESTTKIPRDELYAMLVMLIARGLVRVLDGEHAAAPPCSGVQLRVDELERLAINDGGALARSG